MPKQRIQELLAAEQKLQEFLALPQDPQEQPQEDPQEHPQVPPAPHISVRLICLSVSTKAD